MKAQAYYDKPKKWNMTVRIFPKGGIYAIADLPLKAATDKAADEALRKMRLRRCSAWTTTSWGMEARVCFITSNQKMSGPAGAANEE